MKQKIKLTGLFYVRSMKDMGYSYDQITRWAGVSKRTVINWYHGYNKPVPAIEDLVRLRLLKFFQMKNKPKPQGFVLYRKDKVIRKKKPQKVSKEYATRYSQENATRNRRQDRF